MLKMQLIRNISINPEVRVDNRNRVAGVLENYAEGEKYAEKYFEEVCAQQELENKRKDRAQTTYEKRKQLTRLRVKAEKIAEEKLGSQLEILQSSTEVAPCTHWWF